MKFCAKLIRDAVLWSYNHIKSLIFAAITFYRHFPRHSCITTSFICFQFFFPSVNSACIKLIFFVLVYFYFPVQLSVLFEEYYWFEYNFAESHGLIWVDGICWNFRSVFGSMSTQTSIYFEQSTHLPMISHGKRSKLSIKSIKGNYP